MFKRATWTAVGLLAGLGTSKWVERKARRKLARYLPVHQLPLELGAEAVSRAAAAAAERLDDLRLAVEEGRTEMAAREQELRARLHLAGTQPPARASGRQPWSARSTPIEVVPLEPPRAQRPPSRRLQRGRHGLVALPRPKS